jgi:hypothetical protein
MMPRNSAFVRLTNANPAHKGEEIALRKDIIISVREGTAVREDGVAETVTLLYASPHGTWEVVESMDEVLKAIK